VAEIVTASQVVMLGGEQSKLLLVHKTHALSHLNLSITRLKCII